MITAGKLQLKSVNYSSRADENVFGDVIVFKEKWGFMTNSAEFWSLTEGRHAAREWCGMM